MFIFLSASFSYTSLLHRRLRIWASYLGFLWRTNYYKDGGRGGEESEGERRRRQPKSEQCGRYNHDVTLWTCHVIRGIHVETVRDKYLLLLFPRRPPTPGAPGAFLAELFPSPPKAAAVFVMMFVRCLQRRLGRYFTVVGISHLRMKHTLIFWTKGSAGSRVYHISHWLVHHW